MTNFSATIIVGAGYTGKALAQSLQSQDLPLLTIVSSARSAGQLQSEGIQALQLDFDQPLQSPVYPEPASVVYLVPPPQTGTDDARLDRFLENAPQRINKFVYISTSGVYGDRQGQLTSEQSKLAPLTERAKRRVAAEKTVQRFCDQHDIPLVILRTPGIYGPGRLPLKTISNGDAIICVSQAGPGNRIHRDDLVTIIGAACQTSMSGIYNVGDGNAMSSSEFTLKVAELAGFNAPPQISREQMKEIASERRWSFLNESRRLDVSKLHAALPRALKYANPEDGIRQSLRVSL